MNKQKGLAPILIILIAAVVGLTMGIGGRFYYENKIVEKSNIQVSINQPVVCTQEAKICSDGSSVGRTGPNCEFTECPKANITATTSVDNIVQEANTTQIIDCGISVDNESLPEVKQKTADGGTLTTRDYEKDKALVCFGNNLLVCNKAKIKLTVNKPDVESGVPLGMEIKSKDGQNCIVRLDLKEIMINGENFTNKYLECPFAIKDIPEITCPMGLCLKEGASGSTGIGMLVPFAIGIQFEGIEALKNGGCLTDL